MIWPATLGSKLFHSLARNRKRFTRHELLMAIMVTLAAMADVARGMDLVVNGQAKAVILLPEKPLPMERYAADELRYHAKKATGAELAIQSVGVTLPEGMGEVRLGRAAHGVIEMDDSSQPANAFAVVCDERVLCIAGNDGEGSPLADDVSAGTLFGVYEVLETHFGVRWLWPGELGEVVSTCENWSVPAMRMSEQPRLLHTRLRTGHGNALTGWSSAAARNHYIHDQQVFLRRHRLARGVSLEYGHAFIEYWDRFGKNHPEWFNLLPDGRRRSDPAYCGGANELVSMCVSTPELWRQIVEDWQHTRTIHRPWINCAENDTAGRCVCPNCLAWDVPAAGDKVSLDEAKAAYAAGKPDWTDHLGSLSDRYARFCLAVQNEARKIDDQAVVLGYAYANFVKPPVNTRLNNRVVIAIVPAMMYPWTDAKRQAFRDQWEGWAATGARLYLRPNYTLDGHAMPIDYAEAFGDDFRFAYERGMIATDFDSLTGQWAVQGPTLYVLMRVQHHGDWPVSRILDEYYNGFGSAAHAVRDYFDY
ncbi:MAG: DUF4838 domain-containing protein, partial [Phycisphaeraceae bacterium]|nr:DUF4838 domain-containing protein [Phycisphaeraceae bacterium]